MSAKKVLHINNIEAPAYTKREAYNSFRTNLQFCGKDIKVIAFTSCLPFEGKSTVVFELARSVAEDGRSVVVIDADMRKSVMVGRYKMDTEGEIKGVTHYLSGQAELEDVLYSTDIKGLDMIVAGHMTPNPTELLGGQLFHDMVKKAREAYDLVLIDTPPLGSVIDTAVAAPDCDGIILVIESRSTNFKIAREVQRQAEMTGCKIIGAVLNKVEVEGAGYGYYKGYYKKYYGKEK